MDNGFNELVIVKRSGQRVTFNGNKIALAIKKAFDSVYDTYDEKDVNLVYEKVLKYIEDNYKERKTINVEDIQDIIEAKLKETNKVDVYESFSNYRLRRAASRKIFEEKQQHKFIKAMEKLATNFKSDSLDNPTDVLLKFGKTISEEFAKSYLIDSKYVRNHEEGNIFIHNLDFYTLGSTKSGYIDLSKIKVTNCYLDYLIKLLLNIKQEQYGEHTITSFDYVIIPYLVTIFKSLFENYLYKYLDIEGFLDYVDFNDLQDEIETFEKIDIDIGVFNKYIKSDKVLGIFKKAYNDSLKELRKKLEKDIYVMLYKLNDNDLNIGSNKVALSFGTNTNPEGRFISVALLEVFKKYDFNNITLIFKVKKAINTENGINYDLLQEVLKLVQISKNIKFNFIDATYNKKHLTDDYKSEVEYLPNGERLLENINPEKCVSTGRIILATTSINLTRVALNTKNKNAFFKELENVLELAKNELIQTYEYLSNKPKETFKYLFKENIYMDSEKLEVNQKVRKVLRNGSLNIGIVGLKEATTILSNDDIEFGLEILEFINSKLDNYSKNDRVNFTLKEAYTKKVMEYFLSVDKTIYGTIPGVTDKKQYEKFINLLECDSIDNKMKYIGKYQSLTNGGHVYYAVVKNTLDSLNNMIKLALKHDIGYMDMKVSDQAC